MTTTLSDTEADGDRVAATAMAATSSIFVRASDRRLRVKVFRFRPSGGGKTLETCRTPPDPPPPPTHKKGGRSLAF